MSERIILNNGTNTENGDKMANAIARLEQARQDMEELLGITLKCINGSDYTDVDAEFGMSAGNGQTLYNLLAGAVSHLNNSAISELTDRVGRR